MYSDMIKAYSLYQKKKMSAIAHPEKITEKFTLHCKQTLMRSALIASHEGVDAITPAHLFRALYQEKGGVGRALLLQITARAMAFQKHCRTRTPRTKKINDTLLPLTAQGQRIVTSAVVTAYRHGHTYIGTEHLLRALVAESPDTIKEYGMNDRMLTRLREDLDIVMKSASRFTETLPDAPEHHHHSTTKTRAKQKKTPALSLFCRDLTKAAEEERIDPVIGRDAEIERLMIILARRSKNNPMLLGESGVGKTAIVEGFARRIAEGQVPPLFQKKRVMALDVGALVAGTVWRGEFEARVKQLIHDIEQSQDVILFIDEMHTIMGSAASAGGFDAGNFLKPMLARGALRCIGATTPQEYKKTIETDPALERRFQPIVVTETTPEMTNEILKGLAPLYERHHGITIAHDAITESVRLAKRYFPTAMLPDKAIDILDEAAAALALTLPQDPIAEKRHALETELATIREAKENAVTKELLPDALTYHKEEGRLLAALALLAPTPSTLTPQLLLDTHAIRKVVARVTRLPEATIADTPQHITTLASTLSETIVGQDAALATIAATLERAFSDLRPRTRPRASFFFIGASGVGKTETAKTLARTLFPGESAFVRIDMGELAQGFHTSKLIGAPPGYIGYREGTALTDRIKNQPASVVLFDEIEKAHPEAISLILGLLDDGMLTDATGKRISFRETIIICTSNIGTREGSVTHNMGFTRSSPSGEQSLRILAERMLPVEFLNRFNAFVVFPTLSETTTRTLVDRAIDELVQSLMGRNVSCTIDPAVRAYLAAKAHNPDHGARAIRRTFETHIENPVASLLLRTPSLHSITITCKDNTCIIEHTE